MSQAQMIGREAEHGPGLNLAQGTRAVQGTEPTLTIHPMLRGMRAMRSTCLAAPGNWSHLWQGLDGRQSFPNEAGDKAP